MNCFKPFAAIAIALFSIPVSAGVYRWVDTDGHVHYTDKAEADSEQVNVHTGQPKGAEPLPSGTPVPPPSAGSNTSSASSAPLPVTASLADRQADCEQKKKQYSSYKNAVKIIETDGLGRKHEYSDDEQKQLVTKSQEAMQASCGSAGMSYTAQ